MYWLPSLVESKSGGVCSDEVVGESGDDEYCEGDLEEEEEGEEGEGEQEEEEGEGIKVLAGHSLIRSQKKRKKKQKKKALTDKAKQYMMQREEVLNSLSHTMCSNC